MRRHMNGGSVPQSADLITALSSEHREVERVMAEDIPTAVQQVSGGLRAAVGLAPKPVTVEDADAQFEDAVRHMPPSEA